MNKIRYGLSNVYYAVATEVGGALSYGAPIAIPGGVNLEAEPKGEKTEFYADNIAYFVAEANQGYEGSLEVALIPDSFKKNILNYKEDANGALFEDANALPNKMALMFEFQGDAKKTRHVFYNVTVSRPAVTGTTKGESLEPQTDTFEFDAGPDPVTGYPKASLRQDQAGYDTFFNAVYSFQTVSNSIAPTGATFDKFAPSTLVFDITSTAANTINQVRLNGTILTNITDYTVAALEVTILTPTLTPLTLGTHTLTIVPQKGLAQNATITVVDTTT